MYRKRLQTGVTLIELMVTVTVLGIILTVGVPSLGQFLRNSELNAVTHQIQEAMVYARAEAVNRQRNIRVCPLNQGNGRCRNGRDWSQGMVVYEDLNGNGNFNPPAEELKVVDYSNGTTVRRNGAGHIQFNSFGRTGSRGTFTISVTGLSRQMTLASSGRIRY